MKTNRTSWMLGLLIWLAAIPNGWSFYNPSTGRWLNRDPIAEEGFVLTRKPKSTDLEMEQLLQVGLDSFGKRDRVAFSRWLEELSIREAAHQRPYDTDLIVEGPRQPNNSYLFNQNDAIDQIDSCGLFTYHFVFPCVNICCELWPVCHIYVTKPNRFPRRPILLSVCLNTATTDMGLACLKCDYAGFSTGCTYATRCFQFLW